MEVFHPAPPQSYLQWYLSSLGMPMLLAIVGVTLLAMVLVIVLFLRGRGPAVPAAIAFLLPLPLIVGALGLLDGSIQYLSHLAHGSDGPLAHASFSYALVSMTQASSCFCPLLMLGLALLMAIGFRDGRPTN
jgi:hypothetical protein